MKLSFVSLMLALLISARPAFGECVSGNCTNGKGTLIMADGNKFVGSFKNGKFEGEGEFFYTDGGTYKGEFKNGKFHGKGIYQSIKGKAYEGDWKNGLPNGLGVFRYSDGSVSKGHFKDGKLNGFGTYIHPNGKKQEGNWKDDVFLQEKKIKKAVTHRPYSREELKYFVNENAKNLPIQTDSITRITGIMLLSDNTILYKYTINKDKLIDLLAKSEDMPVNEFYAEATIKYGSMEQYFALWKNKMMKNSIISRNCSTPSVKEMLDRGVAFKHSYFDNEGIHFYEVFVNRESCN